MTTDGQLEFNGREVVQIKSKFGDLELDYLPEGLTREQLAELSVGDRVHVGSWFVVESVTHGEKYDRQGAVGKTPFARSLSLKTLKEDFTVDGVITRTQRQEMFERAHGATA